jgi:hypothetical protein
MSSTSMLWLESSRSTCIGRVFRVRPRAVASPWPMVHTASEALCSTPSVALQSQPMRLACRSSSSTPPSTWRTSLKEKRSLMTIVYPATLMWSGRLACLGGLFLGEAVSGTSAAAMNAAVMADGHAKGDSAGAREALEAFWRSVSKAALFSPLQRSPMDILLGRWTLDRSTPGMHCSLIRRIGVQGAAAARWNNGP